MFENYREMSDEQKAQVKATHRAIRKETSSREGNLAWAFVRGLPYRRVERKTRTQTMPDGSVLVHNKPCLVSIAWVLKKHIPSIEKQLLSGKYTLAPDCPLEAWVNNPNGAIPAPVRQPRKPFVKEVA